MLQTPAPVRMVNRQRLEEDAADQRVDDRDRADAEPERHESRGHKPRRANQRSVGVTDIGDQPRGERSARFRLDDPHWRPLDGSDPRCERLPVGHFVVRASDEPRVRALLDDTLREALSSFTHAEVHDGGALLAQQVVVHSSESLRAALEPALAAIARLSEAIDRMQSGSLQPYR